MRPKGSAAELERRRRRAVELLRQGKGVREVARMVVASPGSVTVWRQTVERQGKAGLAAKPHPGRPPSLDGAQVARLLRWLAQGATAHGYVNRQWTLKRIAKLIHDRLGVTYDPSGVWHLLRRSRWSCQMPEQRARERDPQAVAHFRAVTWPRLKKSRG
jgi:transposase